MNQKNNTLTGLDIEIDKLDDHFEIELILLSNHDNVYTYKFKIHSEIKATPKLITLKWKVPALNVKGVWKCGELHKKRLQYDWERDHLKSRVSVDAPIINVFGHDDLNVLSFACSDAINLLEMNSLLREEDNHLHNFVSFFKETHESINNYEAYLRIDLRPTNFSNSIKEISKWWESFEHLKPSSVPSIAKQPLYSSWYQFHQSLDEELILKECSPWIQIGVMIILVIGNQIDFPIWKNLFLKYMT